MVQQWRGPPWNAPIWPLLPLILNRSIEAAALSLNNVFTSITVAHCLQTWSRCGRRACAVNLVRVKARVFPYQPLKWLIDTGLIIGIALHAAMNGGLGGTG